MASLLPEHGAFDPNQQAYWCKNCGIYISFNKWADHLHNSRYYPDMNELKHGEVRFYNEEKANWCSRCKGWYTTVYWDMDHKFHTVSSSVEKTLSEHEKLHGSFEENATISQLLRNILRQGKRWDRLSFQMREALDMSCNKIARILCSSGLNSDDWHDIAGYATLVEKSLNFLRETEKSKKEKK